MQDSGPLSVLGQSSGEQSLVPIGRQCPSVAPFEMHAAPIGSTCSGAASVGSGHALWQAALDSRVHDGWLWMPMPIDG